MDVHAASLYSVLPDCIVWGAARECTKPGPQAGRLSTSDSWEVVEMKQLNRFLALLVVLAVILLTTSH